MNFVRSRLSVGNLLGLRCRQVTEPWSHRGMCNKPQEAKSEPTAPVPAPEPAPRPSFRVPGYKPSEMDRRILIWSGRFKSADQIPETVSFEMIDSARNKIRVKAAYMMMAATIAACMAMVFLGKQAAGRNQSLTAQNMEKKAKWREEYRKESENTINLSGKAH